MNKGCTHTVVGSRGTDLAMEEVLNMWELTREPAYEVAKRVLEVAKTADAVIACPPAENVMANVQMKLLCWLGIKYQVTASKDGEGEWYPHTEPEAKSLYDDWILKTAKAHPATWLPIDPGMIVKLQAVTSPTTTGSQYDWFGIVSGGGRMPLPKAYIAMVFTSRKVREAEARARTASAAGRRPKPVDVSDVGAAVSPLSDGPILAPTSTSVVVGAPEVGFLSGGRDYCVAYSLASAVLDAGDAINATKIGALAPDSVKQQTGVDRVGWVQIKCRERVQPVWEMRKLRNVQVRDVGAILTLLAADGVVTVIQLEDSGANIRHCVAARH